MPRTRKSDTRVVANALRILHLGPHFPVLPAKEQQWLTLLHQNVLHFRNEDRMIAGGLGRVKPAFQVCQRTVQNRGAVAGAVEACSGFGFRRRRAYAGSAGSSPAATAGAASVTSMSSGASMA